MPRTRASCPFTRLLAAGLLAFLALLLAGIAVAASPPVMARISRPPTSDPYFGHSVAIAGDVNGDGYADIVVGSHLDEVSGTDDGRSFVFFGGTVPDTVADVVLVGEAAGDQFGYSVGAAGDVNGDGFADVIVGARMNDAAGTDAGRAYVFFGGPAMDAVADLVYTGLQAGDQFGTAVATAGDVNDDGFADVVVGALYGDVSGPNWGSAYVFHGGPSPDTVADYLLGGPSVNSHFGTAVATAGDVNGDDYDDVIVGSPYPFGTARIYHGGTVPDNTADLTLAGEVSGDRFGCSVGNAGDVNGDGYDDVIVGARSNDAAGSDAGRAYVFHGGVAPDAVADLVFTGEAAGEMFGGAVAGLGDVNGDGYDDVIVGAWGSAVAGIQAGRVYVFHGGPDADARPDAIVNGRAQASNLGVSVSGGGDVNGDGHPDAVAGAQQDAGGRAYVYDLGPVPAAGHRLAGVMPGASAYDELGNAVGTAGDVNGDGYDDVLVSAWGNDTGGTNAGAVHVCFGGPGADLVADVTVIGEAASDGFGRSAGTAGDVNGDGYDDVIVGAPFNDAGGDGAGRAYVYFGGPAMDAVADLTLPWPYATDNFGWSVGTAGDVNGDGYDDVVVGAPGYFSYRGTAQVFFGGATPDAVADLALVGARDWDFLGWSVGTAGDVNGDGYGDVVVGALENDAAGSEAGAAYVLYGGVSPDATADLTLTGKAANHYFGCSVATAGDVDGDGYDDVIVGAQRDAADGTNAGRAYVFYGGGSPDSIADRTLTGETPGDYFGYSVGTAGDVNGDGYADVFVGAPYNDAGGEDAGRVYVFYGGPADSTADVTLSGAEAGERFGRSAGTAGDVFGDGFADVVVGGLWRNLNGNHSGAAYLYDFGRFFVTSPNGGETWFRDTSSPVTWLGAEPADLWLSLDAGATYARLRSGVGGADSNAVTVTAPGVTTDLARVKVTPRDTWITGHDAGDAVFTIRGPTGVEPEGLALRFRAPWPNPSHGLVRFGLELARPTVVTVSVLDVAGREVARPIAAERFEAGKVEREWRPDGLAPGVYTVRAKVGDVKLTRRLVWLGGR